MVRINTLVRNYTLMSKILSLVGFKSISQGAKGQGKVFTHNFGRVTRSEKDLLLKLGITQVIKVWLVLHYGAAVHPAGWRLVVHMVPPFYFGAD